MAGRDRLTDFDLPTPETVPWSPPVADEFTRTWWDACRERTLLVRHCGSCDRRHFPPRRLCPNCWSDDVTWNPVSGRGTIYSYSVVRVNDLPPFNAALPYAVAVVELHEGPRLMTTIVSSRASALAVGVPVEVEFVDRDPWTFPAFRVGGPGGDSREGGFGVGTTLGR